MNEKDFWARWVKPTLNDASVSAVAWKVQDAYRAGLPDVLGSWEGMGYLMELKYEPSMPKRATTLVSVDVTPKQRLHLQQWEQAGSPAFVLLGIAREWYLCHPWVPEKVPQTAFDAAFRPGTENPPWLAAAGPMHKSELVGLRRDLSFLASLRAASRPSRSE